MSNLSQRKLILKIFLMVFSHYSAGQNQPNTNEKPNVILIYVDDLGYGDISIAGGQIPTPAIDRLGHEGLQLQNAYSTAATCTPSRYSLLTGEYAWRAKGRGVAPGDAILQLDWMIETILTTLEKGNLTQNTIVILTSDNGSVLDVRYEDDAVSLQGNHRPTGVLSGGKYSSLEAGARVPMLVRWPKEISSGEKSDALFSQVDMIGSFAGF